MYVSTVLLSLFSPPPHKKALKRKETFKVLNVWIHYLSSYYLKILEVELWVKIDAVSFIFYGFPLLWFYSIHWFLWFNIVQNIPYIMHPQLFVGFQERPDFSKLENHSTSKYENSLLVNLQVWYLNHKKGFVNSIYLLTFEGSKHKQTKKTSLIQYDSN